MQLSITPVAPTDEAALTAWCAVTAAATSHDSPLWRPRTLEMVKGWMSTNHPGDHTEGYLADVSICGSCLVAAGVPKLATRNLTSEGLR